MIAHNHIYWGHGISIGSETNAGVTNVHVYDNSFDNSEEGLRIKSDYARGGEVSNIYYENICIRNALNALLFTPYYSTKSRAGGRTRSSPTSTTSFSTNVGSRAPDRRQAAGLGGEQRRLRQPGLSAGDVADNVVTDSPSGVAVIASDAQLTLNGVNLPIAPRPMPASRSTACPRPSIRRGCWTAARPMSTSRRLTSPFGTTGP